MKKYIIPLVVAATAVIHSQAADLATQLLGYWTLDAAQTVKVAEKANREIDGLKLMFMEKKMVYEFQKDQMIIHVASPDKVPAVPYTVKAVDEKTKSLTLDLGGEIEMKIRLDKGKMAHNDPDEGWMIYNPMSKEDFAKFAKAAEAAKGKVTTEPEGGEKAPATGKLEELSKEAIPDKPANGTVYGKAFTAEKAIVSNAGTFKLLKLSQGTGLIPDMEFSVWFRPLDEGFQGKRFLVNPNDPNIQRIRMERKLKEGGLPEGDEFKKYSMRLEFGTEKDGKIPGKIELRLPDTEKSFVIGTFEAEIE